MLSKIAQKFKESEIAHKWKERVSAGLQAGASFSVVELQTSSAVPAFRVDLLIEGFIAHEDMPDRRLLKQIAQQANTPQEFPFAARILWRNLSDGVDACRLVKVLVLLQYLFQAMTEFRPALREGLVAREGVLDGLLEYTSEEGLLDQEIQARAGVLKSLLTLPSHILQESPKPAKADEETEEPPQDENDAPEPVDAEHEVSAEEQPTKKLPKTLPTQDSKPKERLPPNLDPDSMLTDQEIDVIKELQRKHRAAALSSQRKRSPSRGQSEAPYTPQTVYPSVISMAVSQLICSEVKTGPLSSVSEADPATPMLAAESVSRFEHSELGSDSPNNSSIATDAVLTPGSEKYRSRGMYLDGLNWSFSKPLRQPLELTSQPVETSVRKPHTSRGSVKPRSFRRSGSTADFGKSDAEALQALVGTLQADLAQHKALLSEIFASALLAPEQPAVDSPPASSSSSSPPPSSSSSSTRTTTSSSPPSTTTIATVSFQLCLPAATVETAQSLLAKSIPKSGNGNGLYAQSDPSETQQTLQELQQLQEENAAIKMELKTCQKSLNEVLQALARHEREASQETSQSSKSRPPLQPLQDPSNARPQQNAESENAKEIPNSILATDAVAASSIAAASFKQSVSSLKQLGQAGWSAASKQLSTALAGATATATATATAPKPKTAEK